MQLQIAAVHLHHLHRRHHVMQLQIAAVHLRHVQKALLIALRHHV
jgi:hypothetical protein